MELIRKIIVPTGNSCVLTLPDEMIGKRVEVIDFERNKGITVIGEVTLDQAQILNEIKGVFKQNLVDMSNYKFDREEANNYNE